MFARPRLLGVAVALVLFTVGLSGSVGAQPDSIVVTVTPIEPMPGQPADETLVDQPLRIVIHGLQDDDKIMLRVTSRDAGREEYPHGVLWQSAKWSTEYRAGSLQTYANGVLTLPTQNPTPLPANPPPVSTKCTLNDDDTRLDSDDIMRLFSEMIPVNDANTPPTPLSEHGSGWDYVWSRDKNSGSFTVEVHVRRGNEELVKSVSVERSIGGTGTKPDPTDSEPWQLNTTGTPTTGTHWYGQFFDPPRPSGPAPAHRHPGILIFGGSEGGLHWRLVLAARLLAAHGYTALALAYWKGKPASSVPNKNGEINGVPEPYWKALPPSLEDIPLETFRSALHKLAEHADVRNDRLFVSGTSRGAEAALWLASHPEFVDDVSVKTDEESDPVVTEALQIRGVIANVPSSTMHRCFDGGSTSCDAPAWIRLDRTEVGYADVADDSNAVPGNSAATISVSQFGGPVFLDCGGFDYVWRGTHDTGCNFLGALVTKLEERTSGSAKIQAFHCGDAGHGVGTLVPYVPWDPKDGVDNPNPSSRGLHRFDNQAAYAALWPQLLRFLASNG